jgi:Glycosyl transferase family 2
MRSKSPDGAVHRWSQPTHAVTWALIVADDGWTNETSAYLARVQDAAPVPVTVIADATSRVLPAAINQGLRVARGEYLVVLNNDVVVTDGWLGQVSALAIAKGVFTGEHAETKTEGEGEGRPAVDLGAGAGSGDPRTARGREGRPAVDSGAGSGDPRTSRGREGRPAVDSGAGSGAPWGSVTATSALRPSPFHVRDGPASTTRYA